MKKLIFLIIILTCFSCAKIRYQVLTPDGTQYDIEYTRWGDQKIEGLEIVKEPGLMISLDKQEADAEMLTEILKINRQILQLIVKAGL